MPIMPTPSPPLPLLPATLPRSPPSTIITSKNPCPSVEHERGGGGKSSRVLQIRRKAAVSWNRTQRSPAEALTRKSPVPGQGKRTLARGCRPKRRRAAALHWNRASAGVVVVGACFPAEGGVGGAGGYERYAQKSLRISRKANVNGDDSSSFGQRSSFQMGATSP